MAEDPEPLTAKALQAAQHALSVRLATVRRQVHQLTLQAATKPLLTEEAARLAFAAQVDVCAAEVQQILTEEAALRRAVTLLRVAQPPARAWRADVPTDTPNSQGA